MEDGLFLEVLEHLSQTDKKLLNSIIEEGDLYMGDNYHIFKSIIGEVFSLYKKFKIEQIEEEFKVSNIID